MVVQFTFGFITPSGNIIRALLLALNQSQIACSGQAYLPTGSPQVYGGPICLLILQIAGLFTFLVAYDGGHLAGTGTRIADTLFFWKRKQRHSGRRGDPEKVAFRHSPPADVLSETKRAEDSQDDALRVLHLSKRFGRSKEPVVDDMTFGVKHGEVYASLGPNGAGKVCRDPDPFLRGSRSSAGRYRPFPDTLVPVVCQSLISKLLLSPQNTCCSQPSMVWPSLTDFTDDNNLPNPWHSQAHAHQRP